MVARAVFRREAPDLAFVNGTIATADNSDQVVQAVAVAGGRIAAVGSSREILELSSDATDVIDLQGRSAVPGFTENHLHVLETSVDASWIDCTPRNVRSIKDIAAKVAAAAKRRPQGEWILGWGFDESRLAELRYPTRHDLDPVSTNHPVALRQVESMSWTANTAGLRQMGINDETVDPRGGSLLRDESGAPLGPMWDNCRVQFVFPALPQWTVPQLADAFGETMRRLNSLGITSVNDAGVVSADQIAALQRLRDAGDLTARVYLNLYVVYGSGWDEAHPAHRLFVSGLSSGFGDDLLRIGPAVIGVDGGTGSCRSALFEPYRGSADRDRGGFRVDEDFLNEFCAEAQRRRFQIAAVAHGDHAISVTLDAFERAMRRYPGPPLRHRLEHAYLWRQDLFERARRLGVVLSSQPSMMRIYRRRQTLDAWGAARSEYGFPYRSCRDAGVIASGGSDCPVVTPNPFVGIDVLMNRRLGDRDEKTLLAPSQRLDLLAALRVYTINGAYADHAENRWGSIEPGKYADLAVLNDDLFSVSSDEIGAVTVDATYLEGRCVYRADSQ